MFDVGFSEILVVLAVFFIFVRPEDFPEVFRMLGRFYRKFQRVYHGFMNEFDMFGDESVSRPSSPSNRQEYKK